MSEGKVYLDLADTSGGAIKLSASGWTIEPFPAVRFVQSDLTRPFTRPARNGNLQALKNLLNLPDAASFQLVVTWCVSALMPLGPYPLLAIGGEQGSGKTLFTSVLHDLVDPSALPLRALPRSERELFIACANAHLLAFDNVSTIADWLSDAFCKIATGGGMSLRKLFTDDSEIYFEAIKPLLLNGIDEVVKRPDLASRAIIVALPSLAETDRIDTQQFREYFEACRPIAVGALLDLMARALSRLPTLKTERLSRMTGFCRIGIAIEDVFGPPGCFMDAFDANRVDSATSLAERNPMVAAIRNLAATKPNWRGNASDLAKLLEPRMIPPRHLDPAALGGQLRRVAPVLRDIGISLEFARAGKARERVITIAARARSLR